MPDPETQEACFGTGAQFYVQVACTYEPEEIQDRKLIGLLIGCLTIVGALIVKVFADYLE